MTASTWPAFTSPWRFWQGAGVLAAAMTAFVLLSWAHMEIVRATIGFEAYLGDGPRLPPSLLLTSQAIKALALLSMLWLVGLVPCRLGMACVGLKPVAPIWIIVGMASGLAGFVVLVVLAKLMASLMPAWLALMRPPFAFGEASPLAQAGFLLMTLVVTPFAEEVFFRGFVFRWMAGHRPVWLAAGVSSFLFGVAHIIPSQAIAAALMGLLLCALYRRTGSVWPAIAAHAVNNALGILLGAAAVAGALPDWLTP